MPDITQLNAVNSLFKKAMTGAALATVDNLVVLAAIFGVKIDDILIFQDCGVIQISA